MAAANFNNCLAFTLQWESGFVYDARDPGGATNLGITATTLALWRRRPVSVSDVRSLSRDEASEIYRAVYWNRIAADALPPGVDLMLFDIAVNMGVGRAEWFQDETAHLSPVDRIPALDRLRCGFWRALRSFPVFGKGWLRRETACKALAEKMVH
jgi:lysozyme family protein